MDIQAVKETAWRWYQRASAFWMLQTVLFYLAGCFVAGKPIGPVEYVRFQAHVVSWRPQQTAARSLPVTAEGASFVPPALTRKPEQTSAPVWVAIRKTEVMERRGADSRVVAVLEAGTPVRYLVQRAQGWLEIEEIVRDGSHPPAHGFVQRHDMDLANKGG